MKVLLLHQEDEIPKACAPGDWDLIVDLGRAPKATYSAWKTQRRCPAISLFDFAEGIGDVRKMKALLRLGRGRLMDHGGIDWWDVLSPMIFRDLLQIVLLRRLARKISLGSELYASRSDWRAVALKSIIQGELSNLEPMAQRGWRRISRYAKPLERLNSSQATQVLLDKFDSEHTLRHFFARKSATGELRMPGAVLLPSAYVNVSKTAVSFAKVLPDTKFLLVCARASAKLEELPVNVNSASLDYYVSAPDNREAAHLKSGWQSLRSGLIANAEEFRMSETAGLFDHLASLLRWGLVMRNAWTNVIKSHQISGCLSADDTNPYSRVPLILANLHGLPAIACHHGAMDYSMAVKEHYEDVYLAKSDMELDYLVNECGVDLGKVSLYSLQTSPVGITEPADSQPASLVWFTEPYALSHFRVDEIYRDLLPRLATLAHSAGLKVVLKIHPFESVKQYRRILKRTVEANIHREIEIVDGFTSELLWQRTKLAITGESSMAVECSLRGIPVFLCGWLRDPFTGYADQFTRFGFGTMLPSSEQILDIPRMLAAADGAKPPAPTQGIGSWRQFHELLSRSGRESVAPAEKIGAAV